MHQSLPTSNLLSHLLRGLTVVTPGQDRHISALSLDSRTVSPHGLFLAVEGHESDGRHYIQHAIERGAIAIVYEAQGGLSDEALQAIQTAEEQVIALGIPRLNQKVAMIAARFYQMPAHRLLVSAVTGTNGKTTCSYLLAHALTQLGQPAGLMGTLGHGDVHDLEDHQGLTTPGPIQSQNIMALCHQQGLRHIVCEASSHGLAQNRLGQSDVTPIDVAMFTQLGEDHLSYHQGSLDLYAAEKRKLFCRDFLRVAVLNLDDVWGQQFASCTTAQQVIGTTCQEEKPHVQYFLQAHSIESSAEGLRFHVHSPWGDVIVTSPLLGRFQVNNLLTVLGALLGLGVPLQDAAAVLSKLPTVPGRMQSLRGDASKPQVIIDYAHTEDALRAVLQSVKAWCQGRIWCVFGCGGNRDIAKRQAMGQVAEQFSDHVILTDDNPRDESPQAIIASIKAGLVCPWAATVEHDRDKAIGDAIEQAHHHDVIVIAGKGHEQYIVRSGGMKEAHSDFASVQQRLGCVADVVHA